MPALTRRGFLTGTGGALGAIGLSALLPDSLSATNQAATLQWKSPFRVAVITDEISQDFEKACFVAAHEFGMQWVEVRELWNKT